MKIAMLTNNYKPFVGGVPISVERQAEELIKLGHEVTVFAPDYEENGTENEEKSMERIIRYRTSTRKMENGMIYPKLICTEVLDTFEKEKFDCIHVHHPMFVGPMALYLGKRYQLPVIYTYHTRYEDYLHYIRFLKLNENSGSVKKKIFRWGRETVVPGYMKWFTNQCDLVLAPTAGMRERLQSMGTHSRVEVLPTGLKDEFYRKDPVKAQKIRDQYLGGRKHLLCSVSRLEEEKNPGFLLNGIAEVKAQRGNDFMVLLIGEGSMREKLEEQADKLGIMDVVTFVGNVENNEVKHFLNASELFLFASKSETQGIVLAEAMAAENPVVAVKASGVEDIVRDRVNGYVTEEDLDQWAQKVSEALKVQNYERLKEQARITAEGFRASVLALYAKQVYEECISRKYRETFDSERGGTEYENAPNRAEHPAASIYRLFKAS